MEVRTGTKPLITMRIATKNRELDYDKPIKQKIYSRIVSIFVYKLDKSKDISNTTTMSLL